MKNRRSLIFRGVILFLTMEALCPFKALAEESVTVPGIVEVEENHLYMVPIGTEDGIKKGDTVEIIRNDQKIADARLISVLPDNSMAEIVVLFVRTDILESDSVKFIKRIEKPGVRRTLGGTRTTTVGETAVVAPVRTAEERRRGLLGSEMHRYEEVTAVEEPLKEEIAQLKAGLVSVRGDYEEKIDTILSAVERSTSKKEALDAEKQWKEKLISTEKRYQAQYRERKKLLENEAARLEAEIAKLNNELKVVNEGTDNRIQQLLSDLRDKEDEISALKQTFVEEHLTGEKQWKDKLENLEAQYQNQLRTQKESLEEAFAAERDKLQNDINYLTDQVELVKASTGSQNSELQVRLKEREDLIDSLRKEQIGLESDLSRQNEQVRKLESDVVTLKDVIAAAKRVHDKELEIARKPLEKKIEDMSVEFISVKHDYERELNALRQGSQEDLLKNESQWVEKLAAVEQKYQNELSQLNAQSAAQVNQLRAELEGQKNVDELLKQNRVELTAKLKASEQQLAQSQNDLNALGNELSVEKATRQEKIDLAKQPLEAKVAELSAALVSMQTKKGEDESLIEFLNSAMADLTADLEERDQKIVQLEKGLSLSQGEIEAMKKSHLERIELAKEPLEAEIKSLNEKIVSLKQNHENQIKGIQENTSRDLLVSEEQWQAKFAAREKEHGDVLSALKEQMGAQVTALQESTASSQKELELIKEASSKEISALQAQWEEKLSADAQQWQAKLNEAESGYQKTLNEELGKKQSVVDFLKEEKSDLVTRMDAMRNEYDAKMKEMEVVARQGQAAVNEQWSAKLAEMEREHQSQLEAGLQEKQRLIDTLGNEKTDLAKQISAIQKDHEQKVKGIEENSKRSLTAGDEQWQARINEKEKMIGLLENDKARLATEIASLKKGHAEEIGKIESGIKKNITANDQQWQARLKSEERALEGKITSLNDQLNFLKKDSGSVINDLENQLKKKQSEVSTLTEEKSGLSAKLAQKESQLARSENNVAVLESQIKETESSRSKWIASVKKPLEEEIKSLNDEIARLKKKPEEEWKAKFAESDKKWNEKLVTAQQEYQEGLKKQENDLQIEIADLNRQLTLSKGDTSGEVERIQADLQRQQDAANLLEKEKSEMRKSLSQKDAELAKLRDEINDLKEDLNANDFARLEGIKSAKQPLEDEIKALKEQLVSVKKDYEDKLKTEGPREVAALKDQLREIKGNSEREMELLKNELEIERREVAKLEKEKSEIGVKFDRDLSNEKRLELANSTLEAEVKKLNTQFEFLKDDHQKKMDFLRQQAMDDMRASEEKWKAQLAASEAQWKTKWAVREAELQKETAAEMESLENRIFGGKKEVQETIVSLNNRLNMLKNSSDSQIRELEADLAAQQYQLTVREAEFQERLMQVDQQWSEKTALAEKRYQEEVEKQKRTTAQGFLDEKKELRETVVDLTRQFNELRANSSDRIKDLEGDLERKEYKLSLLENQSQQDLLGTEEKWQAKLAAIEEKRQRELLEQKQELEKQSLADKEKLQATVGDLNRQINVLRDQFKLDLALKEEAAAAEAALLERKYQDQLAGLKEGKSSEVQDLASKTGKQQDLIDSLQEERTSLKFDLEQRERELAKIRAEVDDLKKEGKMAELSQSEKTRLSKQSLEATIGDLTSQLAITKKKAEQERDDLEIRWKEKLKKTEEDYLEKIRLQRENLEEETAALANKIGMIEGDRGNAVNEMRIDLEDNQTLIRLLSKEKYELAAGLEEKSRMIVMLNEEIIDLKEDLETYKDMLPLSSSSGLSSLDKIYDSSLVSGDQTWYDDQDASRDEYYAKIRDAILSRFREFDFSDYEGKESVVKIDFELLANGSPKKGPEFLGTQDQGLKDLLTRCFEDALPFPPFPEDLGKESQRFSLGISFRKQ